MRDKNYENRQYEITMRQYESMLKKQKEAVLEKKLHDRKETINRILGK